MGDPNVTELVLRAKNASNEAFAAVGGNLKRLKGDVDAVNRGSSFGQMEGSLRRFDDVLQLAGGPNLRDLIQGVGQLDDVATGTAGKLGLLAKAGLAASAAMGGWQIGRKIAELTGSDTLIGNATAKLMGWGDAAGQAAAVGADVLARASKNAGRQITDMTEAIRINEEATKRAIEVMARSNAPAQSAAMIASWRGELEKLRSTGVLENLQKDLASQNFSQKDLADRYRVSMEAVQLLNRQLDTEHKALDKVTRAADEHAEKIRKLFDSYRGSDAITAAKEAIEALHQAERTGFSISDMTRERADALNKVISEAIDVNRRAGATIPDEWMRIARETTFASMQGIADITELIQAVQALQKTAMEVPVLIPRLSVTGGIAAGSKIGKDVGLPQAPEISKLFQIFGSSKDFGAQMASTVLGAIQGGGNPVAAAAGQVGGQVATHVAKELTTHGGKMITGALGGIISAGLPIVGSLIGPLMGKVFGSIKDKFFGTAGRDSIKDFAQSLTGSSDLNALHTFLGKELPADAERFWKLLTQETGRKNAGQAAANIKVVTDALEAQKQKHDEVAAAAEESAAAQKQVIDDITAKYAESLSALDSEYKGLADSVGKEAEEAEMGLVEKKERARMLEIEKDRDALEEKKEAEIQNAEDTYAATQEAARKAAEETDRALRDIFDRGYDTTLRFKTEGLPDGVSVPQHGTGGYFDTPHVAVVGDRPEYITPRESVSQLAGEIAAAMGSRGTLRADPPGTAPMTVTLQIHAPDGPGVRKAGQELVDLFRTDGALREKMRRALVTT